MDKTQLNTSSEIVEAIPVINVTGEIDIYTAPTFKEAINEQIAAGYMHVLIDMSQVVFMDSSGFGTLLSASKPLRPTGGTLSLCCCNEAITRMLEITRLNTLVPVYETREEALRHLKVANQSSAVAA